MKNVPSGMGACCLPRADGLTYIKIGTQQHVVGMMNLEKIFRQLYLLERSPEEVTGDELVSMARGSNYIPPRADIEADYAVALRRAYSAFCERQAQRK